MLLNTIHIVFLCRIIVIFLISMNLGCRPSSQQSMGPPTIPIYLSSQNQLLDTENFLQRLLTQNQGKHLVQYHILLRDIQKQSQELEISQDLIQHYKRALTQKHIKKPTLSHQLYAVLYAWSNRIMQAEIQSNPQVLEEWYTKLFPNHHRWTGTQVSLKPPQSWNDDHHKRYQSSFAAWARLKLNQIRHQFIEGADFISLVKEYSHMPDAAYGGVIDIEAHDFQKLPSHIHTLVADLRPGEISPPIQDPEGVSIFYHDHIKEQMTLQGEALFLSHSDESSTHMLQSDTWRTCLNQFQEALPQISVPRPRESEKARQRRLRKAKRKQKESTQSKSTSWETLDPKIRTQCKVKYLKDIPNDLLKGISKQDYQKLTYAPLQHMIPPIKHPKGIYVVRLKHRSFLPHLSKAMIRWIRLDLSKEGLQKHWSSWGLSMLSQQVWNAVLKGQSKEILKHLSLKTENLKIQSIPLELQDKIKSYQHALPKYFQHKGTQSWTLVHLQKIEKVTLEQVQNELMSRLMKNHFSIKEIDAYLNKKWQSLQVKLFIGEQEIDLPKLWTKQPVK